MYVDFWTGVGRPRLDSHSQAHQIGASQGTLPSICLTYWTIWIQYKQQSEEL